MKNIKELIREDRVEINLEEKKKGKGSGSATKGGDEEQIRGKYTHSGLMQCLLHIFFTMPQS